MASPEQKLTDDEKFKLLEFYKENRELWVSHGVPKTLKIVKKDELVAEFQGKFTIEALERTFHSLKAGFTRESKKYGDGNEPKKTMEILQKNAFFKRRGKNRESTVHNSRKRDSHRFLSIKSPVVES